MREDNIADTGEHARRSYEFALAIDALLKASRPKEDPEVQRVIKAKAKYVEDNRLEDMDPGLPPEYGA